MASMSKWVQWFESPGRPLTVGGTVMTGQARHLAVRWPGGGLSWSRPAAVVVERDGQTERLPIHDPTRAAQVAWLASALFLVLAGLWLPRHARRTEG
jgi:hypothetical protein